MKEMYQGEKGDQGMWGSVFKVAKWDVYKEHRRVIENISYCFSNGFKSTFCLRQTY